MTHHHPAYAVANAVAILLAEPTTIPVETGQLTRHRQQLAFGPTGIALLHIERAAAGLGPWERVHTWLAAATAGPITSGPDSHPFYGAPALAHAVARAAEHQPDAYRSVLLRLDEQLDTDVRRRLETGHRRIDSGRLPELAEFDAIRGLVGYGVQLLHRDRYSPTLSRVLNYFVHLTDPLTDDGETVPGWWSGTGPSGKLDPRFPGGHANNGIAHGIGGVLAFLALAVRKGHTVGGHHQALRTILAWLDRWQNRTGTEVSWPYWITRDELREGRPAPSAPRRPSWCYGTAGLARAQQLAALALGDAGRLDAAEHALLAALSPESAQLKATIDNGLCHGFAGLAHVAARAAEDAHPATAAQLRARIPGLLSEVCPVGTDPTAVATALASDAKTGPGLLDGAAGTALALLSPASGTPPISAWDTCLLIA